MLLNALLLLGGIQLLEGFEVELVASVEDTVPPITVLYRDVVIEPLSGLAVDCRLMTSIKHLPLTQALEVVLVINHRRHFSVIKIDVNERKARKLHVFRTTATPSGHTTQYPLASCQTPVPDAL